METLGQAGHRSAQPLLDKAGHLLGCEGELVRSDLQELSPAAEPLHGKWGAGAPRQDQVKAGGRVAAEGLDEAGGGAGGAELVDVVDDQDEVAGDVLLQDLGEPRTEGVRMRGEVGLGAGEALDRERQLAAQLRDAEPEGVGQPARQRGHLPVGPVGRVPGTGGLLPPRGEER